MLAELKRPHGPPLQGLRPRATFPGSFAPRLAYKNAAHPDGIPVVEHRVASDPQDGEALRHLLTRLRVAANLYIDGPKENGKDCNLGNLVPGGRRWIWLQPVGGV